MFDLIRTASPFLQRRNTPTPLSSPTPSPQLNWRIDGTPYYDNCPPTPVWDSLPPVNTSMSNHSSDYATLSQIAWTAYQSCTRRMNGACVANRTIAPEEQQSWWEESSRICLNAILLHRATIDKQYSSDTAKHLETLENAYYMVQTMLESLSAKQEFPVREIVSRTTSVPSSTHTLSSDEAERVKRPKRLGMFNMFGKARGMASPKGIMLRADDMVESEADLW